ncbi:4Fe-4S dicluster domain-containing protein [Methanogenium sp. MK-MG]|uniref:4Fe-4S dicluster domain-containing protein n=1 Tax=Methanogenium sp. MK-MG TaxID=2599926 RepID=UPI0013EE251A|nr:4Fe-4S dicluster domain-containing protein [Methanogenium sp. MK-MG]KAF1077494.1 NAD(P)H-quinone oxidoreductase subunit I, chloroplastic [Methanogenium sp. MK-MG]
MQIFTMTKRALANLVGKPATLMYPATPAKQYEISRGHVIIAIEDCIYCGNCQRHCVSQAIVVDREARTWEIDRLRCIICGVCAEVCPKDCIFMEPDYPPSTTGTAMEFVQGPPAPPKAEKKPKAEE